ARIDFGDELAFFYRVADLHVNLFKLAGNLGADVYILVRLELALRRDDVLDGTVCDQDRNQSIAAGAARRASVPVPAAGDNHKHYGQSDKNPVSFNFSDVRMQ